MRRNRDRTEQLSLDTYLFFRRQFSLFHRSSQFLGHCIYNTVNNAIVKASTCSFILCTIWYNFIRCKVGISPCWKFLVVAHMSATNNEIHLTYVELMNDDKVSHFCDTVYTVSQKHATSYSTITSSRIVRLVTVTFGKLFTETMSSKVVWLFQLQLFSAF